MLTRKALLNGDFVDAHAHLVASKQCLSREQILDSMTISLKERPAGAPVWIFAYGSLMWNPWLPSKKCTVPGCRGGVDCAVSDLFPAGQPRHSQAEC